MIWTEVAKADELQRCRRRLALVRAKLREGVTRPSRWGRPRPRSSVVRHDAAARPRRVPRVRRSAAAPAGIAAPGAGARVQQERPRGVPDADRTLMPPPPLLSPRPSPLPAGATRAPSRGPSRGGHGTRGRARRRSASAGTWRQELGGRNIVLLMRLNAGLPGTRVRRGSSRCSVLSAGLQPRAAVESPWDDPMRSDTYEGDSHGGT